MAEPGEYLIVAQSGRALAAAATRAGLRVRVLDLFADTDTRSLALACAVAPGDLDRGFDEAALVAAAQRLAPAAGGACGLVYGAGLETRPRLIGQLSAGRRLYGNSASTVASCKDPHVFFPLLEQLEIPHPQIAFAPPPDPEAWLAKRAGGAGGAHIAPAPEALAREGAGAPDEGMYYQRRCPGRAIGVSFLADGERARVLGFSEQWPAAGTRAFRFGGMLQPARLEDRVARAMPALLDALVRATGLVGLNSLDLLVDGERYVVLEVNPRPGANVDIFDGADSVGLFARHLRACSGELPAPGAWRAPAGATASGVVYADAPVQVPDEPCWPAWIADRPAPGTRIGRGAPFCTVLAAAATPAAVRALLAQRAAAVQSGCWREPRRGSRRTRRSTAA